MDEKDYKELVNNLKIGKKLPDAIYLHKSALKEASAELHSYTTEIANQLLIQEDSWDIAKFSRRKFKLSLLSYPDFSEDSYPALKHSYTINLHDFSYRKTNYTNSTNPPILHRKESFILNDNPHYKLFKSITKEGEQAGLYTNVKRIGFRRNWEEIINNHGYELIEGRLQPIKKQTKSVENNNRKIIERHKTAIDRNKLSSPIQSLFRHNYLRGTYSLFDYGCGKGDDINILANHQIEVKGFDPVYFPHNQIRNADIVNLGFVINVIENQKERKQILREAYSLSNKLLVVSVMLGGEAIVKKYKKYGDGIITARNTFQKYYSQSEIRSYIEDNLKTDAIAVGPGLFYVFKDKLEEQQFLVERQRLNNNWQRLSYTDHPERLKIKQQALFQRHKDIFINFWETCLTLGRMPANDEFSESEQIRSICSSHQKAFDLVTTIYGLDTFNRVSTNRRNDLLVSYALGLFGRKKAYSKMPKRLQRDVKFFFEKYQDALSEATELLFSVGKPQLLYEHCTGFHEKTSRGLLVDNHSYTIHRNDVELLPAPLRVYIGCATQLYGDLDSVDLIKIHIRSAKVSLMRYDDFEEKALPLLVERIKIKMREQEIDFFDYGDEFEPQPLYLKSRYINEAFVNYKKQTSFDKKISNLKMIDLTGYGPSHKDFQSILKTLNAKIIGFKWIV